MEKTVRDGAGPSMMESISTSLMRNVSPMMYKMLGKDFHLNNFQARSSIRKLMSE
jgi:hypothetical protein